MRALPLRLSPGSDLRLSIEEVGRRENGSGFVLGVVGNLSRAAFQCPGRVQPTVLEGNLEIITLNGTFSPKGVHLHLSLSDGDCQVWGGHLEPGTIVLKGAEILVGFSELPLDAVGEGRKDPSIKTLQSFEIAVLPGCPWSARALRMLKTLQVPYKVLNIDDDKSFEMIKKRSDLSTFPQIFIDGKLIGGYDALTELHRSGKLESYR
ncbi:PCC domain-containing protein [Prochlorococcus sp. MIT 1300]|uniref:PCC domain-containing protein n=1 Tax=Prochlorococcus sp. MIT 1300 TaxID=3096218 RepID=UPI002A750562|nr:DUF296 domain-containing protein [Prochlorococcus sp. MIT 1300]